MRADTQPCQPTLGFPQGETAIDQHVGVVARDQCAIPSATASQNRETHLTEVVLNDTQYAASDVSRRDGVDVLLDSNLHVVTHLHQTDLITLGTGFDLFLGWRTAKQATEEARLVFRLARLLRQVDVVQAGAAVDVLDAPVTLVQRTTNAGPCTVQVVTHVEHRVAAAVFGQGYAAGGVVVTGCNQGYRTALGGAAAHAGQHVVSQLGVQAQVGGTRREIDVSRATGRTPDADDIDFTGIALHTWLDAHTHASFGIGGNTACSQTLGDGRGKLVQTLPGSAELTGLRAIDSDTETVVLEVLVSHRPDFSRRTLSQDPVGITVFLQAEIARFGNHRQWLRTRYNVFALDGFIGHVARDRQQWVKALAFLDASRQLHRCYLPGLQVIAAAVTEVAIRAPDPTATAGAGDNQGKCGKSGQSLHCVILPQLNQYAGLAQGLPQRFVAGFAEPGERQTDTVRHQAHLMQRPFHGDRVGFDKQGFVERCQLFVDRPGLDRITGNGCGTQLAHGARCDVCSHRDVAFTAQQDQFNGSGVVTGVHQEVAADAGQDVLGALQVTGGFLDTDDVRHGGQANHGLGLHVAGGAAGHVVEDLRDVDSFGNSAEVQVQAFLGRLVVVRGHQQAAIGAGFLGVAGQFDRFAGRIGARAGDDSNTPCYALDHELDHFDVFFHIKCGRFTRGADRHNGVGALLQVEVHQFAQAVPVEITLCIHGCDQCHHTARNHATAPAGKREP